MSFLVILTVILGFSSSFSWLEFSIVLELAELVRLSLPIGIRPGLTRQRVKILAKIVKNNRILLSQIWFRIPAYCKISGFGCQIFNPPEYGSPTRIIVTSNSLLASADIVVSVFDLFPLSFE